MENDDDDNDMIMKTSRKNSPINFNHNLSSTYLEQPEKKDKQINK